MGQRENISQYSTARLDDLLYAIALADAGQCFRRTERIVECVCASGTACDMDSMVRDFGELHFGQ
jgi:hypothetical protein